jgi:phosphoribosyl-AMP cyclohydrolase
MNHIKNLKYGNNGLIPVVVQDLETREVLMLAYARQEDIEKTLKSRIAHYYSRSRNREWVKGESSGNYQHVEKVVTDCDNDTVLYIVRQTNVACHTGSFSCFYRCINEEGEFDDE